MRVEHIGNATLYLGDCRELLPDAEAYDRGEGIGCDLMVCDAVLTDPPFGIEYRSGYATDRLWSGRVIKGDATVALRDHALAYLSFAPQLVFGSWKAPRPPGTRAVLTWDKGPALGMGALDIPWKPSTEEIYVLGRGFVGGRDEGAVIYCPPVQSMAVNGRQHPNEKPVALLERLLAKLPTGRIADPFMGSGSTAVACLRTGRAFVGVEIDQRYFDAACRRVEEAYRQPRLFAEPVAKPVQLNMLDPA